MALTTLEADTIRKATIAAKKYLEELKPLLDGLNIIYNAVGGVKGTITQANLDLTDYLSGLTKAQLDDALNTLTNTTLAAITNGYTGLAQLAARG